MSGILTAGLYSVQSGEIFHSAERIITILSKIISSLPKDKNSENEKYTIQISLIWEGAILNGTLIGFSIGKTEFRDKKDIEKHTDVHWTISVIYALDSWEEHAMHIKLIKTIGYLGIIKSTQDSTVALIWADISQVKSPILLQ